MAEQNANKISITRALVEVKTLDDRINKAITSAAFVSLAKGRSEKRPIQGQYKDVAEVETGITANLQTIEDLIARRSAIKRALSKANVETNVTIGGKTMTIAEAIDLKNVVHYKETMLRHMTQQLSHAANNIETSRVRIENDVQASIERLLGTDVKNKEAVAQNSALIESTKKAILDMHELSLIDPLGIKAKIEALNAEIGGVKDEIDFVLSEANASTQIEIVL